MIGRIPTADLEIYTHAVQKAVHEGDYEVAERQLGRLLVVAGRVLQDIQDREEAQRESLR